MQEDRTISEEFLIKSASAGSKEAFAILYSRYKNYIKAYCCKIVKDKDDLEDLVQQIFLESWRTLKNFQHRSSFSTWITKITINTCSCYYRKYKKRTIKYNETMHEQVAIADHVSQTPFGSFLASKRRDMINKILLKISPKKRIVFALSYIEGFDAAEISNALNIPSATVRTRLFHARKEFISSIENNKDFYELSND